MAVKIPVNLLNNTEVGWKEIVDSAKNWGVKVEDAIDGMNAAIARSTEQRQKQLSDGWEKYFDLLANRAKAGGADLDDIMGMGLKNVGRNAGEADKGVSQLVQTVKTLNSLNITPRGYEMTAFRVANVVSSLGAAAIPLAIVAAGVGTVTKAMSELAKSGDADMERLSRSYDHVGESWDRLFLKIGQTDFVKGMVRGLNQTIDETIDIMDHGVPTIKGFWAALIGDAEGMRYAKKQIDDIDAAIERAAENARVKAATGVINDVEAKDRRREFRTSVSGTTSDSEISRMIEERRARLMTATRETEGDAFESIKKKVELEINDLLDRRAEILREHGKLNKEVLKDEEERVRTANRDPWRTSADARKEMERELAVLKDSTKELDARTRAQERVKQLAKEVSDLEKHEADNLRIQAEFKEHQLEVQRRINEELRREGEQIARHNEQIRQRLLMQQEQEARKVLSQQIGGEEGVKNLMGQIDPRRIREQIGRNRERTVEENLAGRQRRELEDFEAGLDPNNFRDMARRDAFMKRQQRELAREKQKARASGMRDFNRGQVGSDELQDAQADALRGAIDFGQKTGRISKQQADRMRDMLSETQRNAELADETARQLGELGKQIRLTQDAQIRAERRLALNKAAFEN